MLHKVCQSDGMHTAHLGLSGQGQRFQVYSSQMGSDYGLELHTVEYLQMLR